MYRDGGEGHPGHRFHVALRDDASQRVIVALQNLYRKKLRPVEEAFSFGRFHYDAITDMELEAKSQVLVIGQYSTGKTTFIRHLLGTDFPNMNIGPEPTTDKFTVVIHGEEDRPVEGNSLALIKELPYQGLTRFGTGFLNKLDAAISTSPFLENMTLVDTPGVLSGEMQRHQRAYSFADVARWFADRSDMILILFDAHRLDVSDELLEILMRLKDHQRSIRIVLNKADQVDKAKLRRVYGALMWSMGKVFDNPEVVRVYVGSFWDEPLRHSAHERLFKADQEALTRELTDLPRLSAIRKINQLVRRTNLVRAHACVLSYLNEQTPWVYGRARRREDLLNNMEGVLETVRLKHGLHEADMPDADVMRANLQSFDFAEFPTLTPSALRQLTDVLDVDIQQVLKQSGGSEKVFKFSKHHASPSRPGILSRAGSSIRHLFSIAASSGSSGGGGATTAKNLTHVSPSSSAPKSSPLSSAAAAAAAVATPPSSLDGAATTDIPSRRGVVPDGASADSSSGADYPGQAENAVWTATRLDDRGTAAGPGGGGRETGRGGAKKSGISCCSCIQVLLLVLLPLFIAALLSALEPVLASGGEGGGLGGGGGGGPLQAAKAALTDRTATARRVFTGGTRRDTLNPDGGAEDGSGVSEEREALYRGKVH
eukprot:g15741.t1